MMYIYDAQSLELQFIIPLINSVQWTRRFYDVGGFEIYIDSKTDGLEYLKIPCIIGYRGHYGILLYRNATKDGIKLCGTDLKGLCQFRQIVPPFVGMNLVSSATVQVADGYDRIGTTNAEAVMKHYVQSQMTDPKRYTREGSSNALSGVSDGSRKMDFLSIASSQNRGLPNVVWQAKFTTVAEELNKIGIVGSLGYDISFDPQMKQMTFDVTQGRDLAPREGHEGVTFYRSYKNILDCEYSQDALSTINVLYAGANGEEEQQHVPETYETPEPQGIFRMEGFTSVSGDDADYLGDIENDARAYLKENAVLETIEAQVGERLKYRSDWDLGDTVRVVVDSFGERMMMDKQITEVLEIYEPNNMTVTPTFGDVKNSVIKRMMKK